MTADYIVFNTGRTTNPFYEESKPMTNFEKIKSLTINEMAEFLCHGDFDCEKCAYKDNKKGCKREVNRYKKWLKSKALEANI